MSYKKPSYEGSQSLDAAELIFKRNAKIEAERVKSNTDAFNNVTNQLIKQSSNALHPKQKALNNLNKSVLKSKQNLYNKIGSNKFASGYGSFDETVMRQLSDKIEKYGKINMAIQGNLMKDPILGQQELSSIRNEIDVLSEGIPNIRIISKLVNEAANKPVGSGERLSVAGAPAYQLDIINKIIADDQNSENLQIFTKNNQTMIYDPDVVRLNEKNEQELGGFINLSELNVMMKNGENPYLKYAVKTTPYTTDAFDNIIKSGQDGSFSQDFVNSKPTGVDSEGNETFQYEMTPKQQEAFKNRAIGNLNPSLNRYANGGQFAGMLEDGPTFESIWEDQMGGKPFDSDQEGIEFDPAGMDLQPGVGDEDDMKAYDKFYNTYYLPTLNYLSQVSLLNAGGNNIKLLTDDNENIGTAGRGPKAMSTKGLSEQEIFDSKWAKLPKGKKLKAPNGTTYTKS